MLKKVIIRLLYLTPIGFMLGTLSLLRGDKTSGIRLQLSQHLPIKVDIKKSPTYSERLNWLFNGIVLFIQAWYIFLNEFGGNLGGAYALVALMNSLVSVVSAIFPNVNWNKSLFK